MIEPIKYNYTKDQYDKLISDLTSVWNWDNIETLADNGGTCFYVGNAYMKVKSSSNAIAISLNFNDTEISSTSGPFMFIKIVKNSSSAVIHFVGNNNNVDNSYYTSGLIVAIGPGTNVITGQKENVIGYVGSFSINNYTASSNKAIVCSKDVTSSVLSSITYLEYDSNNVAMTMLKQINSKTSQVVMDNVYIADRCTLATPSFGECTLGDKKYFMVYAIWLPDN